MRQIKLIIFGMGSLVFGVFTSQGGEETGFRFPGGNAERGRETFLSFNCVQCHFVKGVHFEEPTEPRRLELMLGEEVLFVKRYEDIIKAISSPKHVVSKQYEALLTRTEIEGLSPFMTDFTEVMSVRQLMDLTAFLDKVYANANESYGKPLIEN